MRPIRSVLFVTYHFPPEIGGIQTRLAHYLENLSIRGVKSTVFVVTSETRPVPTFDSRTVMVLRRKGGRKRLGRNSIDLLQTFSQSRAEVVHVLTGCSTVLGLLALATGRLHRLPAVVSFFGREDIQLPTLAGRFLLQISTTLATSISTNSVATSRLLAPRARKKTHVLLGGSDMHEGASSGTSDSGRVLFVGRLVKRKGVDDLLRAFALVKGHVGGAKLVVVGEGPEREELTRLAMELGLADNVGFRGLLTGAPLELEYGSCNVCVLPSKDVSDDPATEGLGLSLIEASMYGKPLIGTIHGGIIEVVEDGVNGFLVPKGNPRALADAIVKVLISEDLAKELGDNALRIAKAKFTWEAATDRLLRSYAKPTEYKR